MATRAFIAIDPPSNAVADLQAFTYKLSLLGAKPVEMQNIHITLLFLGDVPKPKMPQIIGEIGQMSVKCFRCAIDGLMLFPTGSPRIVSCRITEGLPELEALNRGLSDRMRGLGLPLEGRRFMAHLTLARCTPSTDLSGLKKFVAGASGPGFEFTCNEIKLKSSVLSDSGAVHKDLFVRPLDGIP